MKRGDVVLVALYGDLGKPWPAIVIQSNAFNDKHEPITVCPVTSTIFDGPLLRSTVEPTPGNGLRVVSQIMVDKMVPERRDRIRRVVGHMDDLTMVRVKRAAILWLGLAD